MPRIHIPQVFRQHKSHTTTIYNIGSKEVKGEGQNRFEWSNNNNNNNNNGGGGQNQMEHVGLSDPNSLYWNTATGLGAWSDQPNIGPSVTSLI